MIGLSPTTSAFCVPATAKSANPAASNISTGLRRPHTRTARRPASKWQCHWGPSSAAPVTKPGPNTWKSRGWLASTAAVKPERTVTESELSADSKEVAPYQVDMGDGFSPFHRDVAWQTAAETLLEQLEFTKATGTGAINSAPAWRRSVNSIC